jgi:hypothetical protein
MPISPSLLAQYKEQSDQQHLDRSHTALQALEAATDRYNLLSHLTSSPSMNPLIPKIKQGYTEELAACTKRVKAFIDINPPRCRSSSIQSAHV